MRKKSPVHIDFAIEGGHWVAKGPRISVDGPTLQATRRRARKAAEEAYGPAVELTSTLHLPKSLKEQIEANKEERARVRAAREALRERTVKILNTLRDDLGASYEDASVLLGVDASVLMRVVHSTQSIKMPDDSDP